MVDRWLLTQVPIPLLVITFSLCYPQFFFSVLGLERQAYTLSHSINPFCVSIFKIGSHKPFAQAGFEL
jgi:hypothetical protein